MSNQQGFKIHHILLILSILCFITGIITPISSPETIMVSNLGFKIIFGLIGTTLGISGTLMYIHEDNKTKNE